MQLRFPTFVLAAVLSGALSAQQRPDAALLGERMPARESAEAEAVGVQPSRVSTQTWMLGVGGANVLDTYMSRLEYTGAGFALGYSTERLPRWGGGRIEAQRYVTLHGSYTESPSHDYNYIDAELTGALAFRRRWTLSPAWTLSAGALAELSGGFTYNETSSNNPAQGRIAAALGLSFRAAYAFRLARRNVSVETQFDAPLIGLQFAPTYGQSYYELYRGHTDRNVCFTQPFNAPTFRSLTTAALDLGRAELTFGYAADVRQSRLHGLRRHAWYNQFVIGFRRRFALLRAR